MAEDKKNKKPRVSKGKQRFRYAKAVKKEYDAYQAQVAEEQKKAGRRSLWQSIGTIVGSIAAIAAAPFTGGASLYLNAAFAGAGALAGGAAFRGAAEEWGGAKREDIEVDRFYEGAAESASATFEEFDEDLTKSLQTSAVVTALTAGVLKSNLLGNIGKKLGIVAEEGANIVASAPVGEAVGHGAYQANLAGSTLMSPLTVTPDAVTQGAMGGGWNPTLMKGLGSAAGGMMANVGYGIYGPQTVPGQEVDRRRPQLEGAGYSIV